MGELVADDTARHLATLRPDVAMLAAEMISLSRENGWPVIITQYGARRSREQQAALFARGRTVPGRIVTHTLTSPHIEGRAFDLDLLGYPREAGMPLWRALGDLWQRSGFRWGGTWGDYGHFEVR